MAQHNELGRRGEEEAAAFLRKNGYSIVERNWLFYGLEVDIIAESNEFLVFVEVKTRTSTQWGNPEDFVGKSRQKRMIEAAHQYIIEKDMDKPVRFDIIGIEWDGKSFQIEHIDDAFLAF